MRVRLKELGLAGALVVAGLSSHAWSAPAARSATVPGVIDLHVDLPYALSHGKHGIDDASSPTNPERLVRGKTGTLVLPLFVLDAYKLTPQQARAEYDSVFATVDQAMRSTAARDVLASPGTAPKPGQVATILSFEGADGFADAPELIVPWIERGACFVGLVHSRNNALAGSSTEPDKKNRTGLTDKGRRLAEVVIAHGGVLDAAHASDAAADEMIGIAKAKGAPVVVTHTGMRALRDTGRNASDALIASVASTDGIVGIDIHSGHIARRPGTTASIDEVVEHIEHAVQVAGIDHVAIGSDLDGGIQMPEGADGAAFWPVLADHLTARGWNGEQIEAVFRANAARVLAWSRAHGCASRASQHP